jgi:hypothetical protein
MVVGAERIAETLGRNDMRMLPTDRAELVGFRIILEAPGGIAAKKREPGILVEERVCDRFELKGTRVATALTQNVDHLAAEADGKGRVTGRSLREHLPEETFGTHGIKGFAFHELRKGRLCVGEKDAVGGIDGRTVLPGAQELGDCLERPWPGYQDERVARARTLGEEFRKRMIKALLVFVELDGVTSRGCPSMAHRIALKDRGTTA